MDENITFPRILTGAPSSGSGKTLITCALLRILVSEGFKPASFKCGPDYIDPMFHREVFGIPSRNLDLYFAGDKGVKRALSKESSGRDIGIIEGVMGFFDGMGADSVFGSSYDICRITDTPAILIVNCKGMSLSVLALVKGFCEYENTNTIKGIILNNISDKISDNISERIYNETGIPVIGTLPFIKELKLPSRHLGLVMPSELPDASDMIDKAAGSLKERLDLKKLVAIAESAGRIRKSDIHSVQTEGKAWPKVRIGIAKDEAFCFYYEDNLELLEEMGAELVFFSPVHDKRIPDVSGLILGGGYPELFAKELSDNISMRDSIRKAADNNMPVLAECGGFLYLLDRLCDPCGNTYPMAGVFDGSAHMTDRLLRFGYIKLSARRNNPFLCEGEQLLGHEFHYYDSSDNGDVCMITKPYGNKSWMGYRVKNNVFAGFSHLYYPSCPEFVKRFLDVRA